MSGIFGGGSQASQTTQVNGLQIQASASGKAIPLVYGLTRISGNLVWYSDFKSTPGSGGGSGGGKGGSSGGGKGSSSSSPTYTAAVIISLCEGPVQGYGQIWQSQSLTSFSSAGLTAFEGGLTQAPWGYIETNYASQALSYPLLGYMAGIANLGTTPALPNYNFEVQGLCYNTSASGAGDADPSAVIIDLLTDQYHGVGFPANRLGSLQTAVESHTIPSGAGPTITVTNAANYQFPCDVETSLGAPLVCVNAFVPGPGQYAVNPATGVYTFNAADAGGSIVITYAWLGDLSYYKSYAEASGLWISPAYTDQAAANTMLDDIALYTDSEFVWSSGVMTIVPRGTVALSANGYTYTPPSSPEFNLTDDDFMKNQGSTGASAAMSDDPVIRTRLRASDQINDITVEYLARGNAYATSIAEVTDQAQIDSAKRHVTSNYTAHLFCTGTAANTSAQLLLQRQYIRNTYSFTLDQRYCLLDPMDLVTLTDPYMGLNQVPVRITEITENDDGSLSVMAEEYQAGLGHTALYNLDEGSGYAADYNADPGNATLTLVYEPPPSLKAGTPVVSVGAAGGANWGGCDIWLSVDNATYERVGRIYNRARLGVLTATLPSGSDPDTTHTLSVDLVQSLGHLSSGTQADADNYRTLCYVDGELIAYETATLQSGDGHTYNLTYLRRGAYGSAINGHASGTQFARIDDNIIDIPLPVSPISYVGKTIYIKLTSFNIYNAGEQSLASVSPITYNPNGAGVFVAPPGACAISTGININPDGVVIPFMTISWTASPDPLFDKYQVQYRTHAGPGVWQDMTIAANTTSVTISPIPPNAAYDAQVRAVRTNAKQGPFYSAWAQDLNVLTVFKTTPPPPPTSLTLTAGYRQLNIAFTKVTSESDISAYLIYYNTVNNLSTAALGAQVVGGSGVIVGLAPLTTYYVWVKTLDTSGNISTTALGPASATTNAVDAGDITGAIVGSQIAAATIVGSNLANNIIDYSKMASGYGIAASVNSLPGPASPLRYTGSLVLLTTNAKLYRWDSVGGAWTVAVDGGDITANSIVASSLVAGIITAPYIGAGAVTASKLYIGDTTNLITDSTFLDQTGYWSIVDPLGTVVGFDTSATTTTNLSVATSALFALYTIPAGNSGSFLLLSSNFTINAGKSYRYRMDAFTGAGNKSLYVRFEFFDATGALVSNIFTPTIAPAGYNPAAPYEFTFTAPAGAAMLQVGLRVVGNDPSAAVGNGAWYIGNPRVERQTTGTLIQNGSITTTHITAAGILGSAITAGTITGDRMTANFIDSETFTTIHTSGQPWIEINGKVATISGHAYGPWFKANDGTYDRVIMGRYAGDWGLWVNDASGNPFFVESTLANGVIVTDHLAPNTATVPTSVSLASSLTGTGNTNYMTALTGSITMSVAGTLQVVAGFDQDFTGGAGAVWHLRLSIDGSHIYSTGGGSFTNTPCIIWAGPVGSGSHTVLIEWAADTNATMSEGAMGIVGLIR